MSESRERSGAQRWTAVVDGKRLRELRRQRGIAKEELAGRAGISLTTVARLERQECAACRTRTLARIAAALDEEPSFIGPALARTRTEVAQFRWRRSLCLASLDP